MCKMLISFLRIRLLSRHKRLNYAGTSNMQGAVVVLNLQPAARINYQKTTTGEWLAHCGACPVPEISNAFNRAGIAFKAVNGLLGLDYTPACSMTDEITCNAPEAVRAWRKIEEWVLAARLSVILPMRALDFRQYLQRHVGYV